MSAPRYRALLVAPDGEWVTDYGDSATVEDVWEALADQGSRWYFYPFHGIIVDHAVTRDTLRLVDAAPPFEHCKGQTVRSFAAMIAATPEEELRELIA